MLLVGNEKQSGLKVGLGTSTVYPESSASAFEIASQLGYDGVELMVGIDPASANIDYITKLQDYYQVAVLSVHSPCLVVTQNVWSSDPWQRLEVSVVAAKRLGADVVVVHPPFRWQREYAENFPEKIRRLADASQITIALENMYPWRFGGRMRGYLPHWDPSDQDFDALTLDLSHASVAKVKALDYVHAWGSRLRHMHLTDGVGGVVDAHLFPGTGDQNAWQVLEEAIAMGYRGHIIHELNTRKLTLSQRVSALARVLSRTKQHISMARERL